MAESQADTATALLAIDHLALRVMDPDGLAAFLDEHCAMQRAESAEGFSVLAPAGARTSLFLSEADDAPARGLLERIVLRVSDLERASAMLSDALEVQEVEPGLVALEGPEGLGLGLTAVRGQALRGGLDFDELTLAPNKLGVYVRGPERIRVEYTDQASTR